MIDLTEFLLARIAEDEEVARAATAGPWIFDGQGFATQSGEPFIRAPYHELDITEEDEAHVVRWRPDRVLAECDAKRQLVQLMVNEVKDARRRPGWTLPDSEMDEKGRDYRAGFENARAQQLPDVLDLTDRVLRLLALPYADHPDFRSEWRP